MECFLELDDGTTYLGESFGFEQSIAGDLVFNTGMTGYPETFTDPSYSGQIVVLTYPLIGNYGVPKISVENNLAEGAESERAHVQAVVVADYSEVYSHWEANQSLSDWLKEQKVPAISGLDTRAITKKLRSKGTMKARLIFNDESTPFIDPDSTNLVAAVSVKKKRVFEGGKKRVLLIDCGCKSNIIRSLLARDVTVVQVPWDFDPAEETWDGILVSNGPGDPKMCQKTVKHLQQAMETKKPVFGICLGHQLISLAIGADTFKLKYGHRSQNQPCIQVGTRRCFITAQNHSYAVDDKSLPANWEPWFFNANDSTNEGIRHKSLPFMSVQFHPEAFPGPCDTGNLFDQFVEKL
jgi:carbamoyl-phosphate synthase small subunit